MYRPCGRNGGVMRKWKSATSIGVLVSVLAVSACSSPSTPLVGSQRETPEALVEDLQSVGVCTGDVRFIDANAGILAIGPGVVATRCEGSYSVTFFPPGDGITTVFSPDVCTGAFGGAPEAKVVWGMNWIISALNASAEEKLSEIADVTLGSKTDAASVYDEFCDALNG